jgi:hypothetical protein
MPAAMAEDQADNPDSWESQAADAERDEETVRMADQDAKAGGLAEEQLDEKSTSQAQFRTMAAAAHNPKFARKVGISPDVAKEFHGADRKQNYKSLPKKVSESNRTTKVMITETRTYKLWENAGQRISEAQLTADQINQIFQQVEQGATAAGGNRTMLGKGKDAASAVNKAWEELKTKVQDSGPIKGVDAMYDSAAEKLKQATGGDQGAMKYVQKYRDFAKKHPVAQSLIYSALIAAAGISTAGVGGAAAVGLFKLVDKLLQGEKFSSAAYSGAKTGAMAYGASKIGDLIKGAPQGAAPDASVATDVAATGGRAARDAVLKGAMQSADEAIKSGAVTDYNSMTDTISNIMSKYDGASGISRQSLQTIEDMVRLKLQAGMVGGDGILQGGKAVASAGYNAFKDPAVMQSLSDAAASGGREAVLAQINQVAPGVGQGVKQMMIDQAMRKSGLKESVQLSESQIFLMIGKIVERQRKLDEGIMDTLKGAAGKAVDWAKTKGTNLTTKITADKLLQAWKKAGSPTDSLDVAKVIQSAGVPSASIKQVYGTMKIPFAGEPSAGAMPAQAAPPAPAAKPAAPVPTAKPVVGGVPAVPSTPAPAAQTPAVPPAPKPTATAGGTMPAQGFNASNVMKMPGMEKYAKPAVVPAAKTANFGGGPAGYGKTTTTIKPAAAKPATAKPAVAAEDASWGMAPEGRGYKK